MFVRHYVSILLLAALLPLSSLGQNAKSANAPAAAVQRLYEALEGKWAGELEYRDFRTDQRVLLPTNLEVNVSQDGALILKYTYDDGPGKTVREQSKLTIDPVRSVMVVTSDGQPDEYRVEGLAAFAESGTGVLELTGPGVENSAKVNVRSTIKIGRNRLVWLRETSVPGGQFAFRHQYSFTRWPIGGQ